MDDDSDTETNIIWSIIHSDKVVVRWPEIEMHYIINGDEQWIPCTCKADTPNPNMQRTIQCTKYQTKPDLAAAPATVLDNPEAAVAALIKIPVAGPRAAAAIMMIKTPAPVSVRLTPMEIAHNGTYLGVILSVMRARKAIRWLIAMTRMMNRDPHFEEPAEWVTVVILPVWTPMQGYWYIQLDICVWLTISRCEHLVLPAASDRLVGAEITIPAFDWLCLVVNT